MGVTVHYCGQMDDLDRVEDFEDRVLDLALELGASARIWRSASDEQPERIVRGLILDLAPGQDPTSLLISPEGWLINLFEIEDAENGKLSEPSTCFVKTQFGPVQGHVALIELLDAVKREFMSDLTVTDEGEYWENRNVEALAGKVQFLAGAIETLADELGHYGMTKEAAEDPAILATRVQRVAELVHRTIRRPSEHPPVQFDDNDEWNWTEDSEAKWDASYREQRRKQERLHRAIEERLAAGDSDEDVFEAVMRDEGLIDLPGEERFGSTADADNEDFDGEEFAEHFASASEDEPDESWRDSLENEGDADDDDDMVGDSFYRDRHPLQRQAMDLMSRLHDLAKDADGNASSQLGVLHGGAGDIVGGLAQALSGLDDGDEEDEFSVNPFHRGLSIVQLKRALRGAAFAFGALFALSREGVFNDDEFNELKQTIDGLRTGIYSELEHFRGREA